MRFHKISGFCIVCLIVLGAVWHTRIGEVGLTTAYAQKTGGKIVERGTFPKSWGRLVSIELVRGDFDKSLLVFEAPDGTIRMTSEEYVDHPESVSVFVYRRSP